MPITPGIGPPGPNPLPFSSNVNWPNAVVAAITATPMGSESFTNVLIGH
jgi:hypothetical protein